MPHRRQFLATTSALVAGGTAVAAGATPNVGSDGTVEADSASQTSMEGSGWSMYGGGPGHAGAATWTTGPDSEPSHAWTSATGWGRFETRGSEPAVVDGAVYVGLTRLGGVDDDEVLGGKVVALDASDGTKLWDYPPGCGGGGFHTPAVVDGTVYLADTVGYVYAVDAETGEHRWIRSVGSDRPASRPTVVDDTVYVSGDRTYALDAGDGTTRWTSEELARPSFWNERLLGYDVREGEFTLVAVDASSGVGSWTSTVPGSEGGALEAVPPPVRDGVVLAVVEGTDEVHAFDADDGSPLWNDGGDGALRPAVDGERVYGSYVDHGLHAHDAESGEEVWSIETLFVRQPAVTDDTLYLVRGSSKPVLEARDVDGRAKRWQVSDREGSVAVADGGIYLSGRGVVVALR